jgi:hypothetical protein
MISHATRIVQGVAYLQLDGNVNHGNSGGPLLNPSGEVVGIVTATVGEATGLGLALPVNYLYEGDQPLLAAPAGIDRAAWKRIAGTAAADEEREVEEARVTMQLPALTAAVVTTRLDVLALVARQSRVEPLTEHFSFQLQRGNQTMCTASGDASRWRLVGNTAEGPEDSRTREWMARHHLEADVWIATVPLHGAADCPRAEEILGLDLVMSPAAPGASRAPITLAPGL